MAIFSYTTETMYAECDMKLFVSHYVDVPRFLECCRQCPNYDKKWSCPNFNFEQNEYWKQFETPVSTVADSVYTGFLQSYGQTDGLKTYGKCVDLLIAYYYETALEGMK